MFTILEFEIGFGDTQAGSITESGHLTSVLACI